MHNFHQKKPQQQQQQQQNPTWSTITVPALFLREQTASSQTHERQVRTTWLCGVVPKELLTFLGSLYKEVAKTTSGAFVYCFERPTARIFFFFFFFFFRKSQCP